MKWKEKKIKVEICQINKKIEGLKENQICEVSRLREELGKAGTIILKVKCLLVAIISFLVCIVSKIP